MFQDRKEAGQILATALESYKLCNGVVLAIPRGGVEVGYYVAEHLQLPLSMVVVRKLPFPSNPEAGFGAVAEDGSTFFVERFSALVPSQLVEQVLREQKAELKRRIQALRGGKALPDIAGRTVILVDDGIAMGSTVRAAIMLCRNKRAAEVVVGAPVSSRRTYAELSEVADEVVILEQPFLFQAVAESYRHWYDVSDDEVIKIMRKASVLQRALKKPFGKFPNDLNLIQVRRANDG